MLLPGRVPSDGTNREPLGCRLPACTLCPCAPRWQPSGVVVETHMCLLNGIVQGWFLSFLVAHTYLS